MDTNFFNVLTDEDGLCTVSRWFENRSINIFDAKMILIPINENLHWYMIAVYNPGSIQYNRQYLEENELAGIEQSCYNEAAAGLIIFDSLSHRRNSEAKKTRSWLNHMWHQGNLGNEPEKIFTDWSIPSIHPECKYQISETIN